jgi:hypothetical protein
MSGGSKWRTVRISVHALTADNSIAKNAVRYVASIERPFVMRSHDRFRKERTRAAVGNSPCQLFLETGGEPPADWLHQECCRESDDAF